MPKSASADRANPQARVTESRIVREDAESVAIITIDAVDKQSGVLAVELRSNQSSGGEWQAATHQTGNRWQGRFQLSEGDDSIQIQITNHVGLSTLLSHPIKDRM